VATLRSHREQLNRLAHVLLERETLNEDDAYGAAGIRPENAPGAVARGEAPGTTRAPGIPSDVEPAAPDGAAAHRRSDA
jgi:cell division protease FtsH